MNLIKCYLSKDCNWFEKTKCLFKDSESKELNLFFYGVKVFKKTDCLIIKSKTHFLTVDDEYVSLNKDCLFMIILCQIHKKGEYERLINEYDVDGIVCITDYSPNIFCDELIFYIKEELMHGVSLNKICREPLIQYAKSNNSKIRNKVKGFIECKEINKELKRDSKGTIKKICEGLDEYLME